MPCGEPGTPMVNSPVRNGDCPNKGGAACRAGLLGVNVGENRALIRDAVYVWSLVAHHPAAMGTDVPETDVVAPDDDNIGLFLLCLRRRLSYPRNGNSRNQNQESKESHSTPPCKWRAALTSYHFL